MRSASSSWKKKTSTIVVMAAITQVYVESGLQFNAAVHINQSMPGNMCDRTWACPHELKSYSMRDRSPVHEATASIEPTRVSISRYVWDLGYDDLARENNLEL